MPSSVQEFAIQLLYRTAKQLPFDFAGLGVVFYERLDELPFIALDASPRGRPYLPAHGLESITSTLAAASSLKSGWHDGFHFVDVASVQLTHLAQFLSPPLPPPEEVISSASGARHMTALLATRVAGIAGVGLLTQGNELAFFDDGIQTFRATVQ